MIDLSKVINTDIKVISDTHFGHKKILIYEPIRIQYLLKQNKKVEKESKRLLNLIETVPHELINSNKEINDLIKFLIPYHDKMLIENWNKAVKPDDTVLHLGDFAFNNIEEYTAALNGNKILLRGNHDLKYNRIYIDAGWKDIIENIKLVIGNNTFDMTVDKFHTGIFIKLPINMKQKYILFSHYPIFNSNKWDIKNYKHITDLLENIYNDVSADLNIAGHTHSKNSMFENSVNVSLEHCYNLAPMLLNDILNKKEEGLDIRNDL